VGVSKHKSTREKVLSGTSNANVRFDDLCGLLIRLGFEERTNSSHHIFTKEGVPEIINLQPKHDGKAKPYQVKQVKDIITRYNLDLA